MKYLALAALLIGNPAAANGLDDLRAALAPLQGQGGLRGTYEAREENTDADKKSGAAEVAQVSAQIDDDAAGLQIRWERGLLKRVAEEGRPVKGAKKNETLGKIINASSATRIANAVNYAPQLLYFLSNSQLKQERADNYQGKPARLLELQITPPLDNDKVKIKENSHLAQIWIDADGLPLGGNVVHSVKASMLVFLSFEQNSKEEMIFAVNANRLVVLRREERGTEKGFGSDNQFHRLQKFTPKL